MLSLTPEQQQFIYTLPEEVQEAVEQQLIAASRAASETRLKSARGNARIEPIYYVANVLEADDSLRSILELISLASEYLLPGALESAKSKYAEDLDKYKDQPLDYMRIIASTGVNKWCSQRDVGAKMQSLLETLNPKTSSVDEEEIYESSNAS